MNFELAEILSELLERRQLDEAIVVAEERLSAIPTTAFHMILGRNLLHLIPRLAKHIEAYDKSTREVLKLRKSLFQRIFAPVRNADPAAYYCEMNGFTINYGLWYTELFSYERYSIAEWEWLSEYYDSTKEVFAITGYEDIQKAYEDVHLNDRYTEPKISASYDVCELLVILRLQELFRDTYRSARAHWCNVPMFVTAHDYDLIFKVN